MSVHVDVVRNDWIGGQQQAVARVLATDEGDLKIESPDPGTWVPIVERAIAEVGDPDDPEGTMVRLHEVLDGSHLFAKEPHDDDACPFAGWAPAAFESAPAADRELAV